MRGSLHDDAPDRILVGFKWVVLELHRRCGASRNRETPRCAAPPKEKRAADETKRRGSEVRLDEVRLDEVRCGEVR